MAKKLLVSFDLARNPTNRDKINRALPLKVMACLSSDEISFLVTSLSAFSHASFNGSSLIADFPPTFIMAYRLLTDFCKIGHAAIDKVTNVCIGACFGRNDDGHQRPGFHLKTRFGWFGIGTHPPERRYDEDEEYIRRLGVTRTRLCCDWFAPMVDSLANTCFRPVITLSRRVLRAFVDVPTIETISNEKRETFLDMLEIKTVDELREGGYDLITLISAGIPLRTLLDRGASIVDMLNVDASLLLDLYTEGVPLDVIINGVIYSRGKTTRNGVIYSRGKTTRRDIENLPRNTQEQELIRSELLRGYDREMARVMDRI